MMTLRLKKAFCQSFSSRLQCINAITCEKLIQGKAGKKISQGASALLNTCISFFLSAKRCWVAPAAYHVEFIHEVYPGNLAENCF